MSGSASSRTTVSAAASDLTLVDVAAEAEELMGKGHAVDNQATALAQEVGGGGGRGAEGENVCEGVCGKRAWQPSMEVMARWRTGLLWRVLTGLVHASAGGIHPGTQPVDGGGGQTCVCAAVPQKRGAPRGRIAQAAGHWHVRARRGHGRELAQTRSRA